VWDAGAHLCKITIDPVLQLFAIYLISDVLFGCKKIQLKAQEKKL